MSIENVFSVTARKKTIHYAIWAGYVLLAIVPISWSPLFFSIFFSLEENLFAQIFNAFVTLLTAVAYAMLLVGVEAVAIEIGNDSFRRAIRYYTVIIVSTIPIFIVGSFIETSGLATILYALFLLVIVMLSGSVSIRIARSLQSLSEVHGSEYKHARYWLRLSGWLMISVILLPLGALLSLVADYWLWRIVRAQYVSMIGRIEDGQLVVPLTSMV